LRNCDSTLIEPPEDSRHDIELNGLGSRRLPSQGKWAVNPSLESG